MNSFNLVRISQSCHDVKTPHIFAWLVLLKTWFQAKTKSFYSLTWTIRGANHSSSHCSSGRKQEFSPWIPPIFEASTDIESLESGLYDDDGPKTLVDTHPSTHVKRAVDRNSDAFILRLINDFWDLFVVVGYLKVHWWFAAGFSWSSVTGSTLTWLLIDRNWSYTLAERSRFLFSVCGGFSRRVLAVTSDKFVIKSACVQIK